jgi:hypothetical protein
VFNPYLWQREKQIDRQEAMARAQRSRLARQARSSRPPGGWQLQAMIAAILRSLSCSLMRRQLTVQLQGMIASRFRLAQGQRAVFHQRPDAMARCEDEMRG